MLSHLKLNGQELGRLISESDSQSKPDFGVRSRSD